MEEVQVAEEEGAKARLVRAPRINLRLPVFCALGAVLGALIYSSVRFHGFSPAAFVLFLLVLPCAAFPLGKKRILALAVCVLCFGGIAAGVLHLYTEAFLTGKREGVHETEGVVMRITQFNGYTETEIAYLTIDGERVGGRANVTLSGEDVRPGDIVRFTAMLTRSPLPTARGGRAPFARNIRYNATASAYEAVGKSKDPFLRLNAAIFDCVNRTMHREEAQISYALLTGNADGMDEGLYSAIRAGGIAHIFAVSGLHIGIFYAVARLLFKPLKKYAFLPALALSACYTALCGFPVSAIRALLACAVFGVNGFLGRKHDFLSALGIAAALTLSLMPAQWLTSGFRLSYGACLGLALFSGSISRGLKKIKCPSFLSEYLSASLAVQLFTFPILMEEFGYFSIWGMVLNLVVVPLLPAAFLTLLLCVTVTLLLPVLSAIMALPEGLFAVLLFFFAWADVSFVVQGFSLGAGTAVWLTASVFLSERVRMKALPRIGCALLASVLFAACLIGENAVFYGCRIDVADAGDLALVRTTDRTVLIIDGEVTLSQCNNFLRRRTGSPPDDVVVLSEEPAKALGRAAFLGADVLHAAQEADTGLQAQKLEFGDSFTSGTLAFRFLTPERLYCFIEGKAVLFDFSDEGGADADLCIQSGDRGLKFFLGYGIIVSL